MLMQGLERMGKKCKELERANRKLAAGGRVKKLWKDICDGGPAYVGRKFLINRKGLDRPLTQESDPSLFWSSNPDRYFSMERIAVYTVCTGGYDEIREPLIFPDNIDYYLITDSAERPAAASEESWSKVLCTQDFVPPEFAKDPVLANRWCKMHPHLLFPEHSLSIYLDANILVVSDLTALANALQDFPVAMFRHKERDCVYEEVEACILKRKDTADALRGHERLLRAHGVPEHYGLLEAPVIVRRHMETECRHLMDEWWESFLAGSRRDQISLIDTLWKNGIDPSVIGILGNNVQECDLFIQSPHPPKRKKKQEPS